MTSVVPPFIYSLPLSKRPPPDAYQYLQGLTFNAVFQAGMVGIHVVQLCILPLHLSAATLPYYNELAAWSQGLFARLLLLIAMVWAPTIIRISVDDDEEELNLDKVVQRNEQGIAVGIDLPERMVVMSNHQVCFLPTLLKVATWLISLIEGVLRLVLPLESLLLRKSPYQPDHHSQGLAKMGANSRSSHADLPLHLHASQLGSRSEEPGATIEEAS